MKNPRAELFHRVFALRQEITPALAKEILALDFPEANADRAHELNVLANEGMLTTAQEAELEACANMASLLAAWQSKARQSIAIRA